LLRQEVDLALAQAVVGLLQVVPEMVGLLPVVQEVG
jgi:hypothetical protein